MTTREIIARIIDPLAWEQWDIVRDDSHGSYGLSGEPAGRTEDTTCRRWMHKEYGHKSCTISLQKADEILSLPSVQSVEVQS